MATETHVIGIAKRAIKPGERIEFRIRPDGFCESEDLRFRSGLAFVDMLVVAGGKEDAPAAERQAHAAGQAQRAQSVLQPEKAKS